MKKCVECGKVIGKFEVFSGEKCVECFAVEFKKEFEIALQGKK